MGRRTEGPRVSSDDACREEMILDETQRSDPEKYCVKDSRDSTPIRLLEWPGTRHVGLWCGVAPISCKLLRAAVFLRGVKRTMGRIFFLMSWLLLGECVEVPTLILTPDRDEESVPNPAVLCPVESATVKWSRHPQHTESR